MQCETESSVILNYVYFPVSALVMLEDNQTNCLFCLLYLYGLMSSLYGD